MAPTGNLLPDVLLAGSKWGTTDVGNGVGGLLTFAFSQSKDVFDTRPGFNNYSNVADFVPRLQSFAPFDDVEGRCPPCTSGLGQAGPSSRRNWTR